MANNGQFKKNNKAAVRKSTLLKKSVYNKVDTVAIRERKVTEYETNDFLPFGDDNLFPQDQAKLNRKSPVSRAIQASKRDYIVGDGFQTDNEFFKNYRFNSKQSAFDISSNLILDRIQGGNLWIEIVEINGQYIFNHIDYTKVRFHKDRDKVIIHPDWSKYDSYKKMANILPLYPKFDEVDGLDGKRSMYHVADYEPTFGSYGIPSNIGGIDSASINYKTNRWNLSRLENSFQSSGILMLNADFEDDDAKNFSEDFDSAFVGEGNQGKPLKVINPATGERNDTKWIPFNDSTDGDWTELHDQAVKELCTANQWFPTLSGINVPSGWDTERIRNEYQIAISTIISKEQRVLIQTWQRLFKELLNQDLEDLEIVNKAPVNMVDVDNIHQAIIDINLEIKEARMSVEMAKATLKISFNLSDEQLDNLFI